VSGKENEVVDLGIVDVKRSRLLGPYEWKLDSSPRLARSFFQDQLEGAKDQSLARNAFSGGTVFQAPIDKIWDVEGGAHNTILRYLRLKQKNPHFY
jgi:hypothetical protein